MQKTGCIAIAFYFGATAGNVSQSLVKKLRGLLWDQIVVGSSTGNLLVALEEDIDKVFKIVQGSCSPL